MYFFNFARLLPQCKFKPDRVQTFECCILAADNCVKSAFCKRVGDSGAVAAVAIRK